MDTYNISQLCPAGGGDRSKDLPSKLADIAVGNTDQNIHKYEGFVSWLYIYIIHFQFYEHCVSLIKHASSALSLQLPMFSKHKEKFKKKNDFIQ